MSTQEPPAQKSSPPGKRLALVVGNNGQPQPGRDALKYAPQSAQAVAAVLRDQCGFELLEDPLLNERTDRVKEALYDLVENRGPDDFLLFYFCGHGEPLVLATEQRDVYLVTQNFNPQRVETTDKEAHISFSWLSEKLYEKTRAGTVLIILDCCYAGNAGYLQEEQLIEALKESIQKCFDAYFLEQTAQKRGERITLAANSYNGTTSEHDGYSDFACCLLSLLREEYASHVDEDGEITFEELVKYLRKNLPQQPSVSNKPMHSSIILATFPGHTLQARQARREHERATQRAEREAWMRSLATDHSGFLRDRLDSFVGREQELAEVRGHIQTLLPTGGYLAITGGAGQGKSSMIAKLIEATAQEQGGQERVAYHFIPLRPTADYQVALLQTLMARLILKYHLSDFYLASESRAALSESFPRLLKEVAEQGGQEIIFIDGLDQLQPDPQSGLRDLSFLPQGPDNPPQGIIFVLGTRPNDTLRPLELLKPYQEYQLRNLSRPDFDQILQHRQVTVHHALADTLYRELKENALFLDLVAKELAARKNLSHQEVAAVVKQLADNPENLFSLSLDRLRWHKDLWATVMKPILGLLLVTNEPLAHEDLKHLLNLASISPIDGEQLNQGLERLGGLVVTDNQGRYSLFHLKFRDHLRQNKQHSQKTYLFDAEDEQDWHRRFIAWCEQGGLAEIWQDAPHDATEQRRRLYARQYYITHLYSAGDWSRLFEVLDEGTYGKAKVQFDPSTRAYALDLELGRRATAGEQGSQEKAIQLLPALWRYTLLACSLASRADQYPKEAFELMLLLGQESKALGLAELLTNPAYKAEVFLLLATHFLTLPAGEGESQQLFIRAQDIVESIPNSSEQAKAWRELGQALAKAQQWDHAQRVIESVADSSEQAKAWRELWQVLAQAQQWEQAQEVIKSIPDRGERAIALSGLGQELVQAQQWEQAREVIKSISDRGKRARAWRELGQALAQAQQWEQAREVIEFIPDSDERAEAWRELGQVLAQAQQWEQAREVIESIPDRDERAIALRELGQRLAQAQQWEQAREVIKSISESDERARALRELGQALAQAQQWEQARAVWEQAQEVIKSIPDHHERARALSKLGQVLAQAQQWEQAREVIKSISTSDERARALRELGQVLAQAQQWEQARTAWKQAQEVIKSIPDHHERARALSKLGQVLAQAQQWEQARTTWEQAQEVIKSISESDERARILSKLGQALAQAQQWEQAREVIESILESDERASALRELGKELAQAQQWEQAREVIESIPGHHERARVLSGLGQRLAQAQQWEQARTAWKQAQEVVESILESDERASALRELGQVLAQAQQWKQAQEVIESISKSDERARAWGELGKELAQAQQWEQARTAWKQAQEVVESISESYWRASALRELGQRLAQAQQWEQAREVIKSILESDERASALRELGQALAQAQQWEQARQVIKSISKSDERAIALRELGKELAQAYQWEQACIAWKQAQEVIESISESDERAIALREWGKKLAQAYQWEQEHTTWKQAQEVIESTPSKYWRTSALRELGQVLVQAQQWEQAQEVIKSISESYWRASALRELGKELAQAQQWEQARTAWKQAQEVIESISERGKQAQALIKLVDTLTHSNEYETILHILHDWWQHVRRRDEAIRLLPLAYVFISSHPELGMALWDAFAWVDDFLKG